MNNISTMLPPLGKSGGAGEQLRAGTDGARTKTGPLCRRQLCFILAFILPVSKLLEAPSLLAYFSKGDLLVPAFFHYALQTGVLIALLYACSRSEKTLFERLCDVSKPLAAGVYIVLAANFVL